MYRDPTVLIRSIKFEINLEMYIEATKYLVQVYVYLTESMKLCLNNYSLHQLPLESSLVFVTYYMFRMAINFVVNSVY